MKKESIATLYVPRDVWNDVVGHVEHTRPGLETGVSLFGTVIKSCYVVLAIAGPGRNASHAPAQYSGDNDHSSEIFNSLHRAMPGITWLGELHVHPPGMTWLSHRDLRTVKDVLTGDDDCLHPEEFIAGVMQRNSDLQVYPFHFTRERLTGRQMHFQVVDPHAPVVNQARLKGITSDKPDVRSQSTGSPTALEDARGHRWLRQCRRRLRRYVRTLRREPVHAD